MMSYHFIDDAFTADIGFTAAGDSAEEMIMAAAAATIKVMVDNPQDIARVVSRPIRLEATSLEMLLFDLLGELIFYKDAEELLLVVEQVILDRRGDSLILTADARGEPIDRYRHRLIVDVKAVTMHCFKVEETPEGWSAMVVLDI
jgi:SHS2 domain-containing protein